MGWVVNSTSRPLYPPGMTWYPLSRRLGGPQSRSGRVRKILPPTGIRSPNRPARSVSLYRLSYPGPEMYVKLFNLSQMTIIKPLKLRIWNSKRRVVSRSRHFLVTLNANRQNVFRALISSDIVLIFLYYPGLLVLHVAYFGEASAVCYFLEFIVLNSVCFKSTSNRCHVIRPAWRQLLLLQLVVRQPCNIDRSSV
jgi:hypothetical protein